MGRRPTVPASPSGRQELVDAAKRNVERGGKAPSTTAGYKRASRQFASWLRATLDIELDLERPIPGQFLYVWGVSLRANAKPVRIRAAVSNAINGLQAAGYTVLDADTARECANRFSGHVQRSLTPTSPKAGAKQAREFTLDVLCELYGTLKAWRANPGGLSKRWLLRMAASLFFGYVFALRISELLDAEWGWLGEQYDGGDWVHVQLTIPQSKWQPRPEIIRVRVRPEEWAVVQQWRQSRRQVGAAKGANDRIFPETSKYRALEYRTTYDRTSRRSGQGRMLSSFPFEAAELDEALDPDTIPANSTKKLHWRCSVCDYRFEAEVKRRIAMSSCASCATRSVYFRGRSVVPRSRVAGHDAIDLIGILVGDPAFHPDFDDQERHVAARDRAAEMYRSDLKQLCKAAGIDPRDDFEYIGTHGPRRGRATDGAMNGADLKQIQLALRQKRPEVTLSYTSTKNLAPSVLHQLPGFVDALEVSKRERKPLIY